ncbi:MAG: acyltransferase [Rudaea sp.]|uniref:acyltransferase family protein n=1 Tax=Rudaea sp. TaxID=2136325 RepID=UPI0039E275AC
MIARNGSFRPAGSTAPSRNPELDGLRGVAIVTVVLHNAWWIGEWGHLLVEEVVSTALAGGWVGVQLFFVLSGFLITRILLDDRAGPHPFKTFWLRRALRIFPLYYLLLIGALVLSLVIGGAWGAGFQRNQWWLWFYLSNWAEPLGFGVYGLPHLWSLAVEEQFYLLWPLLALRLTERTLAIVCTTIVAITPLLRFTLRSTALPAGAAYSFTIARWDALALGALIAILVRWPAWRTRLAHAAPPVAVAAMGAVIVIALFEHGFDGGDRWVQVIGQTAISFASGAIILVALYGAAATEPLRQLLRSRWLRWFGSRSYAIYLVHAPIHYALASHYRDWINGPDDGLREVRLFVYALGLLAVSSAIAEVTWHMIEQPILRLKEHVARR